MTSAGAIKLAVILGYIIVLLLIGGVAGRLLRGTSKDYLVASHSFGPFLLLMTIFGTTMTSFALIGSTGEAFEQGAGVYALLASSSGIVHSLCFFVVGIRLWSFGKRHGYTTQIEFFRDRLESRNFGLVLFPILVGLVIPYVLIGILGAGKAIQGLTQKAGPAEGAFEPLGWFEAYNFGVPAPAASFVVTVVVLLYVFYGGMRSTAWANAFQTIVFMVLGLVTFLVIASRIGQTAGDEGLLASMRAASEAVPKDKLIRGSAMSQTRFFTYMLVPLSVGMFPHLFQHWLTAKRAENFKLTVVAHPLFIMIVWAPCILLGIWGATSLAGLPPNVHSEPNLALPVMVKKFTASMGASGDLMGGLLTAGVLAAIMSSLDSQFLCLGTMFTKDVVGRIVGKDKLSDKATIMLARLFVVVVAVVTFVLSQVLDDRRVFPLGVWCFSGFAALFPLALAAVYWRRLTKWGAYAGVLAGAGSWAYLFYLSDFASGGEYVLKLGAYEIMPVAAMVLASSLAMVVVSLATPPPSEETLAKFFAKPRKG